LNVRSQTRPETCEEDGREEDEEEEERETLKQGEIGGKQNKLQKKEN
jgi:hypothetical protein